MGHATSAAFTSISEYIEVDTKETLGQKDTFRWNPNALRRNDVQLTPVTVVEVPKEWLHDCVKQLTQLSKLDDDWDSYGAEAPNQWAISCAREVLKNLASEDLEPSSIDASVEGGVCLSFQTKSHYGDIECFNSGEVFAVTSKNGEDTEVWEIMDPLFRMAPAISRIQSFLLSKLP